QALESGHRGVHDVDRVVRAERLRQDVVDARALEHRAHRAPGDDAGTGRSRLEEHDTGRVLSGSRMRDGALDTRHLEEVLLGLFDTLGDRRGHLLGLAVADSDRAVTVGDDDQRGEAEAPATLHDLGDPVDRDDPLDVRRALLGTTSAVVPPAIAPAVASTSWGA